VNPIRIVPGILLAAFIAGPARAQDQSATSATAPAAQTTAPATQGDQSAQAAGDSKPARVKIGGRIEQATLIHMVQPVYPKEAKDAHISGTVVVKGVIEKDGSMQQVEYVSGPEELKQAAMDAVKQWQYKPTTLAGNPIEVDTTISLVFSLNKAEEGEPPSEAPTTGGDSKSVAPNPTGVPDALNGPGPAPPPPPHNVPTRIRVGGAVQAANLVHQVLPIYPQEAKLEHISGTVTLHVIVARDGSIQTVEFVSGPDVLKKSAMDAVKQWRYSPTLLNGQPIEVDTKVAVVYSLGGGL
jgi:TonB family protein